MVRFSVVSITRLSLLRTTQECARQIPSSLSANPTHRSARGSQPNSIAFKWQPLGSMANTIALGPVRNRPSASNRLVIVVGNCLLKKSLRWNRSPPCARIVRLSFVRAGRYLTFSDHASFWGQVYGLIVSIGLRGAFVPLFFADVSVCLVAPILRRIAFVGFDLCLGVFIIVLIARIVCYPKAGIGLSMPWECYFVLARPNHRPNARAALLRILWCRRLFMSWRKFIAQARSDWNWRRTGVA
jgi:hypothetical protein